MTVSDSPLPWTRPEWLAQAHAWIGEQLERLGRPVTGPVEQPHVRPWSTVLRVPVADGVVYFKATAPMLAHETALTLALAEWRPDCMPAVLAADVERSWMLLPDAGPALRSLIKADRDLGHWERILPLYAGVQMELAGRQAALLDLGVLDRRLAGLPDQMAQALDDTEAMRLDQPDGLSTEAYQRLRAQVPRFAAMCQELAAYGLPETLHHDDFHDGNIFVTDGRYVFYDWAESCLAHPFFTLVVTLRSIAYTLQLDSHAPELLRLRERYLEPWTQYAPLANLLAALELALRVGMVNRALTWHRVVSQLSGPDREQHAEAVPGWLGEFLAAVEG